MSTKNLARTVIEGGRYNSNKFDRRNSSANERVKSKQFCKQLIKDPELADEFDIEDREVVYQGFSDKLSPMYRWLDAQEGRLWSEVRSEIFQKFDTRTTAGRHITFDHLLSSVVATDTGFNTRGFIIDPEIEKIESSNNKYGYRGHAFYYVDQNGIFRVSKEKRKKYVIITNEQYEEAANWLNGRMILQKGNQLFWAIPQSGIWKAKWESIQENYWTSIKLGYYLLDNGHHVEIHFSETFKMNLKYQVHSDFWNKIDNPFSFRQRGELSKEEIKYFSSLPNKIKSDILSFNQGR